MSFLRVTALIVPLAGTLLALPAIAQSTAANTRLQATASPAVDGFVAEKVPRLGRGVPLNFSVFGSEHAGVWVYVEGVPGLVELREVQAGVYEGTHVIVAGDSPRPDSRVVATMQRGGQVTRATLAEPLVLAAAALPWGDGSSRALAAEPAWPVPIETAPLARDEPPVRAFVDVRRRYDGTAVPPPGDSAQRCDHCGVVESIRVVEAPAPADLPGKVSRAFDDHRRSVLGVLDAIGLPFAARESQRIAESAMAFEVTLRLADGRTLARRYGARPAFRVGDTVTLPPADPRVAAGS